MLHAVYTSSTELVKAGYLKKSPHGDVPISKWRRRWFVLYDSSRVYPLAKRYVRLEYYQSESEAKRLAAPKGIINMDYTHVSDVKEHNYAFDIITRERTYSVAAETPTEKHEWIQTINSLLFSKQVNETTDLKRAEFQRKKVMALSKPSKAPPIPQRQIQSIRHIPKSLNDDNSNPLIQGDYQKALDVLQEQSPESIRIPLFSPEEGNHIFCAKYNVSLLHLTAYHGWLDICDQLINFCGYNPHMHSRFGSLVEHCLIPDLPPPPPLFYATLGGHYEVVNYLISKCHNDPDQKSVEGETPLYLACLGGHYDIVFYLINTCHCDPTAGFNSYYPLIGACKGGNVKIVKLLMSTSYTNVARYTVSLPSIDVNMKGDGGYTPLHTACCYGKFDIVQYLVSLPSIVMNIKRNNGHTLLHTACHSGHLNIIKFLVLLSSVDVNTKDDNGYTPLHIACLYGHLDVVKYLVYVLADINIKNNNGYTPLQTACRNDKLDIVQYLMSLPSVESDNLLHTACLHGILNIVKFLVFVSSVDVNSKDDNGYSPLHIACHNGQLDVIKFLMSSSSVDVNCIDNDGNTPLHIACHNGELNIIKFLLSLSSINENIKVPSYPALLHKACRNGFTNVVQFLASSSSVDLNSKDDNGYNPLHIACHNGQLDVIKFLVSSSSVDVNCIDNDGNTPLHIVCHNGELDIIKFLVSLSSIDENIKIPSYPVLLHKACRNGFTDVVKFLASSSSVDLNSEEDSGNTPLHIACENGQLDIIKFLVSSSSVDVNKKNNDGNTPLHTACYYHQLDIVQFLLSLSSIDANLKDDNGDTPLHVACQIGQLDIIKFLVSSSSVDVNKKNNDGNTPLHTACCYHQLDIILLLLSLSSIDANFKDDNGCTPLHVACQIGQLDIIKLLVSLYSVDMNSKDKDGYTPLHRVCHDGKLDIVKYLMTLPSVDPNIQDNNCHTPLHIACQIGHLDIIKFLVSSSSVDTNIKDDDGFTPLHIACYNGQLHIIQLLLSLSLVDGNFRIPSYPILLHKACQNGATDVVVFLVSSSSVDVNTKDDDGNTPLHTACRYGELNIVMFLMSIKQINPMSIDRNGDTPLHIACTYSNVNVVKYLLSTGRVDPMAENKYKETTIRKASYDYRILKLFEPFKTCQEAFPVESYSKVFLCGNTTNGKTSLANALEQRAMGGVSWRDKINLFKYREKAKPLTAGIVPYHLQSNDIGNMVLYDFSGHPEYYSSHAAVLENVMLRSPAVFIILIKLTDKLEDIEKQLYYWASFIENVAGRMSSKCQVIVVGSHVDKWKAMNGKDLIKRIDIEKIIENQEYRGFVAVDCHNIDGVGFDEFIRYLTESTTAAVNRSESISFYCHVLYAFLITQIDEEAISLENLTHRIRYENEPSLPSNESVLLEFLTILSDKGLILFIKSTDSTSWVVINKSNFLKEINGTLFAPSYFKEYHSTLASNTGIVPVSVLGDVFPQYDPDMLVGFLKSLEFCHEIDENTLRIISTNFSSSSEKLLFFPALVSVEPPSKLTITDGFGWCLWCPNPYQFLSNRFLHVLLLRLAYTFSLKVSGGGIIESNPIQPFDRSCIVWKNGISWTKDGAKIVVQVSEQNRSIILLVQPNDGMEYCEIRSSVIKKIVEVKNEFCIRPDTKEFLISPHHLCNALQCNLAGLSVFEAQNIARTVVLKKKSISNDKGDTLDIASLLGQFEPYHSLPLSVIHQLFDNNKVGQYIPEHLLKEIQERCRPIMDIYPVTKELSTYQSVRDHLNRFSIFAGRNPFDIADSVLTNDEREVISQSSSITTDVNSIRYTIPDDTLDESHLAAVVYMLRDVTPDWMMLGLYLGIDNTTLRIIQSDNPLKVADCHRIMLSTWLRKGGANRNTLIEALEKMNKKDIIETICSQVNN